MNEVETSVMPNEHKHSRNWTMYFAVLGPLPLPALFVQMEGSTLRGASFLYYLNNAKTSYM
jgi:hypothetical protein